MATDISADKIFPKRHLKIKFCKESFISKSAKTSTLTNITFKGKTLQSIIRGKPYNHFVCTKFQNSKLIIKPSGVYDTTPLDKR